MVAVRSQGRPAGGPCVGPQAELSGQLWSPQFRFIRTTVKTRLGMMKHRCNVERNWDVFAHREKTEASVLYKTWGHVKEMLQGN